MNKSRWEELLKILQEPAKPLTPAMENRIDQHTDDSIIVLKKPVKGKNKGA